MRALPAASLRLPRHSMPSDSGWRSAPSPRSGATTSPRNGESGHLAADVGGHFTADVASGVATQLNYGPNKESEILAGFTRLTGWEAKNKRTLFAS